MRLADPSWLVLIVASALPWLAQRRRVRATWPTFDGFSAKESRTWSARLGFVPAAARGGAIACLVIGLARPQTAGEQVRIAGRGVAIALVVDRSSSMKTVDFPTPGGPAIARLDAAKATLGRFLDARTDDLIGVVGFAGLPDTLAPPTLDRRLAWGAIRAIRPAGAGDDGTDIGGAIAWALGALRPVATPRKVLILLTDGRHAPGATDSLDPLVAAEVARGLGVNLHTVAVGRPPAAPPIGPPAPTGRPAAVAPVDPTEGPDLDLLRRLSARGNGRAFVAADFAALGRIFEAIDALETVPIEGTITTIYRERFAPWVAAALGLMALDLVLRLGRLRRLP